MPEEPRRSWLRDIVRAGFRAEIGSEAGRINMVAMLLAVTISGLQGVLAWFSAVVRIFNKNYSTGVPYVSLFAALIVLILTCVLLVGLLEVMRKRL